MVVTTAFCVNPTYPTVLDVSSLILFPFNRPKQYWAMFIGYDVLERSEEVLTAGLPSLRALRSFVSMLQKLLS